MKKILVTGAAGFLGSHLCDELLSRGYNVVGIDNFFRGTPQNLPTHPNFKFYEFNLVQTGCDIFKNENPDIVIHYAAINGTKYFYDIPFKVCDENIRMTQNILNECSSIENIKKIIYASSSEVYGPTPIVPTKETEPIILYPLSDRDSYASSKSTGEFLVRLWAKENEKNYLILRPFNTYGSRMATKGYGQVIPEFIERALYEDKFTIVGDGKQTRSFCHVKDHSIIACNLMERVNNKTLNIGFDEETRIKDLAKILHEILNKKFKPTYLDSWKNDTQWRKPDLGELRKYIKKYKFISLKEGLISLIPYYE
tara:strand:- start:718 stop:1650 length:933 start_codon:yes stop_codon:yes gene_type:complete